MYHARTKHIDVRFHKIRKLVSSGELLLEKVHTSENAADMLTKPVTLTSSSIAWTWLTSPCAKMERSQLIDLKWYCFS